MSGPAESPGSSPPAGYVAARALVRFLLGLFYRRIDVVGADRVPERGGLVVAANHHNSVVDAMLLIAVLPRHLRTLANAPLFSNPLVGPFLRLLGALPVHRRQEAGNDPARNAALFSATTATLRGGGAIAIFPEGRTQPEPVLMELRTGAARMLLAATTEEAPASPGGVGGGAPPPTSAAEAGSQAEPITLLPVGLLFDRPGTFREGRALVLVGAPVPTAQARALAASDAPERAARALTDDLTRALRALIVEADDRVTLRLLATAEELWREEGGDVPADAAGRLAWLQRAMRTYRTLLERDRLRVEGFRRDLEAFVAELDRLELAPADLARVPTPARLAGRALRQTAGLLVLTPLALFGVVLHAVPYRLTGFLVRRLARTDEEEATDKIAAGLLLFPLTWALETWGAWRLGGPWTAAALAVALLPAGFLALAWQERIARLGRDLRVLTRRRRDPELLARLLARRRDLAGELRSMAALVPEEWPA